MRPSRIVTVFRRARRFIIGACTALLPLALEILLYTCFGRGDFHLFALTGGLSAASLIVVQLVLDPDRR